MTCRDVSQFQIADLINTNCVYLVCPMNVTRYLSRMTCWCSPHLTRTKSSPVAWDKGLPFARVKGELNVRVKSTRVTGSGLARKSIYSYKTINPFLTRLCPQFMGHNKYIHKCFGFFNWNLSKNNAVNNKNNTSNYSNKNQFNNDDFH